MNACLDGNVLAGALSELFTIDITSATDAKGDAFQEMQARDQENAVAADRALRAPSADVQDGPPRPVDRRARHRASKARRRLPAVRPKGGTVTLCHVR